VYAAEDCFSSKDSRSQAGYYWKMMKLAEVASANSPKDGESMQSNQCGNND
jgi:hypothetical protein